MNQTLSFPPFPVIDPTFPGTNNGNISVPPDQTITLLPAAYDQVSVFSRSTVRMQTGTYFINALQVLEPQALLSLNQTTGSILIKTRNNVIWRGGDALAGGTFAGFTLAYFGTTPISFEAPFTGILIAPNATVTLGSAGGGQTFTGQFYAKTLLTRPDVTIICREDF